MRNNEKIKDLIKKFNSLSDDYYEFRKSNETLLKNNIEMKFISFKIDFLDDKINTLQKILIYLIKESLFEGNINGK